MIYKFKQIEDLRNAKFTFPLGDVSEETLLRSLCHFQELKPGNLYCGYTKEKYKLEVFITNEDLKFLRYNAIFSNNLMHPGVYVEASFPALLKCLLYENGPVYNIAVEHFKRLLPSRFLRTDKRVDFSNYKEMVKYNFRIEKLKKMLGKMCHFLAKNLSKWKDSPMDILKTVTTSFESLYKKSSNEDFVNVHDSWKPYAKRVGVLNVGDKCKMTPNQIFSMINFILTNNDYEAFKHFYIEKLYLCDNVPAHSKKYCIKRYDSGMNFVSLKLSDTKKRKRGILNKNSNNLSMDIHYMAYSSMETSKKINKNKSKSIGLLYLMDLVFLCHFPSEVRKKFVFKTKMFDYMEKITLQDRLQNMKVMVPCDNEPGFVQEQDVFPIVDEVQQKVSNKNKFKINL